MDLYSLRRYNHNMKNQRKHTAALSAALVLSVLIILSVSGCASTAPADSDDAAEIAALINTGNSAGLVNLSADSFLLDSEILHGPTLTESFWNGLIEAGFTLTNPVVTENRPPQESDKSFFGDSVEVDAFFSRYIPPSSMLFRIASDDTAIVMILAPAEKGGDEIIAFGGPF